MSQLPENEDLKTELFQFFDKYGIAYKYNSGISINLDLYEEFDTTERLLKGLFTPEEAIDNENWSSLSNIEFITPLIFRNQIDFLGNTYYRLLVDDYLKDTFNLHLSKIKVEEIKKIGLLNITSYHGQSLSNSKLYNSNWGYNFNGIITIPRKIVVGDISIDNSEIHQSIEVVDGDVIINSEIETFGGLT
jgi:hypothetical protein